MAHFQLVPQLPAVNISLYYFYLVDNIVKTLLSIDILKLDVHLKKKKSKFKWLYFQLVSQ